MKRVVRVKKIIYPREEFVEIFMKIWTHADRVLTHHKTPLLKETPF